MSQIKRRHFLQCLSSGNLLQEEIRSIPPNLKLKIGVDVSNNGT